MFPPNQGLLQTSEFMRFEVDYYKINLLKADSFPYIYEFRLYKTSSMGYNLDLSLRL